MSIVSCHLMGGLGNQLFQIFTTLSYAYDHKFSIVFPFSKTLTTGTIRPTYWDSFLRNIQHFTIRSLRTKYTNSTIDKFPIYKEPEFSYNIIPTFENNPEILLYGYFQSYKYFHHNDKYLFSLINLDSLQDRIKNLYSTLFDTNLTCVSMHFRIGDYQKIQHTHPILPYEYYENSIQDLLDYHHDNLRILYFCQDSDNHIIEPIINRLKTKFNSIEYIKVDDNIDDWKQMLLMSCCKYNIIANSTFSWWGAYFNQNKDKRVCYPHKWFGPALTHNITDLFPQDWKQIIYNI